MSTYTKDTLILTNVFDQSRNLEKLEDAITHNTMEHHMEEAKECNHNTEYPEEEKKKVTAKSLRIAGTTTMSAGNVDYYSSH